MTWYFSEHETTLIPHLDNLEREESVLNVFAACFFIFSFFFICLRIARHATHLPDMGARFLFEKGVANSRSSTTNNNNKNSYMLPPMQSKANAIYIMRAVRYLHESIFSCIHEMDTIRNVENSLWKCHLSWMLNRIFYFYGILIIDFCIFTVCLKWDARVYHLQKERKRNFILWCVDISLVWLVASDIEPIPYRQMKREDGLGIETKICR